MPCYQQLEDLFSISVTFFYGNRRV